MSPRRSGRSRKKGFFYTVGSGIYRGAAWCESRYVLYVGMVAGGGVLDFLYNDNLAESAGEWIMAAGLGATFSKVMKYLGERGKKKAEERMMKEIIGKYEKTLEKKEESRRNEIENLQRSHKNTIKRAIRGQTEDLRKQLKAAEEERTSMMSEVEKTREEMETISNYHARSIDRLTRTVERKDREIEKLYEENKGLKDELDSLKNPPSGEPDNPGNSDV